MAEAPGEVTSNRDPMTTRNLTNKILDFLSTASKETLTACLVALCAITYLFLGRLGLLLIGAVCGIALHATWERTTSGDVHDVATEVKRRREVGLDIVQRLLGWQDRRQVAQSTDSEVSQSSNQVLDFSIFQPTTGAALTGLVDAVIRDYVR